MVKKHEKKGSQKSDFGGFPDFSVLAKTVRNEISDILGTRELWFSGKQRFWPKPQNPEKRGSGALLPGGREGFVTPKTGFLTPFWTIFGPPFWRVFGGFGGMAGWPIFDIY